MMKSILRSHRFHRLARAAVIASIVFASHVASAAWQNTGGGTITGIRTYPAGSAGLRVEVTVSGADHNCGTAPNIYYFDSDKIPLDVVKSSLAVAMGAFTAGRQVTLIYDCGAASGGFGWGMGIGLL
jgi:hypothetical protein